MGTIAGEKVVLLVGFHPFGDQPQVHAARHGDNGDDQAGIVVALVKLGDKAAIDFELVEGEPAQVAQ